MHRRHATTAVSALLLLLALGTFACSVVLVWLAASNPLELEVREGSVWIHVLASRAGVDLYDPHQVAFVNMNHGPLDPILKTWLSRLVPSLAGHWVTRVFVLTAPVFFLGSAYLILRKNLTSALFAAGALYLFLAHLSLLVLVGRSDATAICFLAVAGLITHQLLEAPRTGWFERRYVLRQLGLGAMAAVVFLTSSRYLPAVGAFQVVVAAARIARVRPRHLTSARSRRTVARLLYALEDFAMGSLLFAVGFTAIWGAVLVFELGADVESYYRHFFGFFSADSGWGTFAGAKFEVFPETLLHDRTAVLLGFAVLMVLGFYRLRKEIVEAIAWLSMILLLWLSLAWGYYKNQGGGGLHYYFEFFVFAWVFILHSLSKPHRFGLVARPLVLAFVSLCIPWATLLAHGERAEKMRAEAQSFVAEVAEKTGGEPVFGEGTHLFKTEYRGEVVDTGDAVHAMAHSRYFGDAFAFTYQNYVNELQRSPPRFILVAVLSEAPFRGIMTPALRSLLLRRYRRVSIARGSAFALAGSQALYELRPPPGSRTRQTPARSAPKLRTAPRRGE